MKIKVIKYYKDIVDDVYYNVDTIREVDDDRANQLINAGVAELVKEKRTRKKEIE